MRKKFLSIFILSCIVKTIRLLAKAVATLKTCTCDFWKCGIIGWCIEILYTSLMSFRRRDMTLVGHTSIWMFPIYGSAFLIRPVSHMLKGRVFWLRGIFYAFWIYLVEFISGCILMKKNACPWNYHHARWQIHDVIRLDFAPFWFLIGLLYESILQQKGAKAPTSD